MIAIFDNKVDALDYSLDIHEYLTEYRLKYNAERWAFENKSDNDKLWMVKIPDDTKYFTKDKNVKVKVTKVPKDWKNIDNTI